MGSTSEPTPVGNDYPTAEYLDSLPDRYDWPRENSRGYRIEEIPSGTRRPLKVIVVGAGASGIAFAKFSREELQNVEIVIYEKNADIGGTWLENRYPGCACDVPSVTYQFTWEPDVWSKFYSGSPEIHAYMKRVVDKYNLWPFINLNHKVNHAQWDEDSGKWTLKIENTKDQLTFTDTCDIFINASGPLNYWEMPKIPGIKDFNGVICHTADYPEGLDLKGKRVAVVGIGSSGIQVTAAISKEVSRLYTWVRSPTFILGNFASKFVTPEDPNPAYTKEQLRQMKGDAKTYLKYRKNIEGSMTNGFLVFYKNTPESIAAGKIARQQMREKLKSRPDIAAALIPEGFPVGCKRPTPGIGFLEALVAENTTAYPGGDLKQITSKGFIDPDGKEQEVDVIILATGFNTTWVPRFPIIARGNNLQDMYRGNPLSYLGVSAPEIPNYFTYYGPYGPLGQASAIVMIDFFTRYFNEFITKVQTDNIKSFAPRMDVALDFQEHADLYLKRTVWDAECKSWWKGGKVDGRIMLYPGSRTQYMELIEHPRYEDFDIRYKHRNRWGFLGNGFSVRDYNGRDLTWFWGLVDDKDKQEEYELDWQPEDEVEGDTIQREIVGPNAL